MNKRAIAILGAIFILIVGTLGFLIYQRSKKSKTPVVQTQTNTPVDPTPAPTPTPTPVDTPPPAPAPGKAVKLTDYEVISPVLFFQGNGITYFNSQGQLFQTDVTASGTSVLLSNKRELTIALKSGITKILWPASGNNFIAEFDTGSKTYWSFYNSDAGTYTDMPSQVTAVDWMPDGSKILLIWVDDKGKATLNTANPDLTGYKTLSPLYEPDDAISVSPDGKSILFWRTQSRDGVNQISFLSTDGKVYNPMVKEGYNVGVKWAPDGHGFVFGRRDSSSQKYALWTGDTITGQTKNLNVSTTPDKVVWTKDSKSVFAAVPASGSGSGLTQDTISKIDISNAQKTDFDPGTAVDASDLFLSNTDDILYFKNNQDRALYYISVGN